MKETLGRRERERQRHREEILDAAEVVFAAKSFHKSTIQDVAERAEFSVGTLYNFFSSKEELYKALIGERFRRIHADIVAALDKAEDPVSKIKAYIDCKIHLSRKYFSFAQLYLHERMGDRFTPDSLWWDTVAPFFDDTMQKLTGIFTEGIEKGCFRNDIAPSDMTIALDGLTDGFMYDWFMHPEQNSFESKFEIMVALFLDGVCKNS